MVQHFFYLLIVKNCVKMSSHIVKLEITIYFQVMKQTHQEFTVRDSGFVINPDHPFLGASPNAISCCACHGKGCVEIKCPHAFKDITINQGIESGKKTCLTKTSDGSLQLDRKHQYYYQIQLHWQQQTYNFQTLLFGHRGTFLLNVFSKIQNVLK